MCSTTEVPEENSPVCSHCGTTFYLEDPGAAYHGQGGEGPLCKECGVRDIGQWLGELDEYDSKQLIDSTVKYLQSCQGWNSNVKTLVVTLIYEGKVDYDDLI